MMHLQRVIAPEQAARHAREIHRYPSRATAAAIVTGRQRVDEGLAADHDQSGRWAWQGARRPRRCWNRDAAGGRTSRALGAAYLAASREHFSHMALEVEAQQSVGDATPPSRRPPVPWRMLASS